MTENQLPHFNLNSFHLYSEKEEKGSTKPDLILAYRSLGIAMRSYLSTYQKLHHYFKSGIDDISHSPKYYEIYSETIIHIQHFFELVIKDILRDAHDIWTLDGIQVKDAVKNQFLLSLVVPKLKPSIIDTKKRTDIDDRSSVTFHESLARLELLKGTSKFKRSKNIQLILENKAILTFLTELRNHVWHRGITYLPLAEFDSLVCCFIFPILSKMIRMKKYSGIRYYLPKPLRIKYDVLNELTKQAASSSCDPYALLLLKELGRSSFESPLGDYYRTKALKPKSQRGKMRRSLGISFAISSANEQINKAKEIAISRRTELSDCPVCGEHCLVINEFADFTDDGIAFSFVTDVSCTLCSFQLYKDFPLNVNKFGIHNYFE